jgi:hypothetical protein
MIIALDGHELMKSLKVSLDSIFNNLSFIIDAVRASTSFHHKQTRHSVYLANQPSI